MKKTQRSDNESFGLIKLLTNYLVSIPATFLLPKKNFVFPNQIDEYFFVQKLSYDTNENVGVALYKSKQGVKVIVKRWEGFFKDYNYYSIKNEANTYRALNDTLHRISPSMPAKFANILIPKLLGVKSDPRSFTMIIEWINGRTISGESKKRKVDEYLRVREFLQYLGTKVNKNDKKVISTRGGFDYLMLFPVVFIIALIFTIDDLVSLFFAAILFLSYLPTLLISKHLTLVHRDLHFDNIMIAKNKTYIIDLQFSVFTYSACEVATTLRYLSNDKKMSKYFLQNIVKRDTWTKDEAYLLKPMIIMLAVHGLTSRNFTKKILNDFRQFLKQGIAMSSKKLNLL